MDFEKKVKVLKMLKDKGVSSSKQLSDLAGDMRKMIELKLSDDCKLVVMDLVDAVSKNTAYFDTFLSDSGEQGRLLRLLAKQGVVSTKTLGDFVGNIEKLIYSDLAKADMQAVWSIYKQVGKANPFFDWLMAGKPAQEAPAQ